MADSNPASHENRLAELLRRCEVLQQHGQSICLDEVCQTITGVSGTTVTHTYSTSGVHNATVIATAPAASPVTLTYDYDNDDHVTQVQDSLGGVTTSQYDPAGRLTAREFGGATPLSLKLDWNSDDQLTTLTCKPSGAPLRQASDGGWPPAGPLGLPSSLTGWIMFAPACVRWRAARKRRR